MLPPKNRKEWKLLLDPKSTIQFNCFPLQMKISKLKREISEGKSTEEAAIDEIRELCVKYTRAVEKDLSNIFGLN
jgi:hypothetical protein